jgi:hypothetical protein
MVPVSSGSGTKVAAVVDGNLGVIQNEVVTSPTGELTTEASLEITDEAGNNILASTVDTPATCKLLARNSLVYAITSSGVTVMDLATGVVVPLVASKGTIPTGCTFGCVYRDRLCLAGADNAIYLSRQGDFTDWNFGADLQDTGRAIPFQLSEAGQVGSKTTALIPHMDKYLLCATASTLWVVSGDPAASGSLQNIHREVGIVQDTAWVKVVNDVFFLAQHDLYKVNVSGEGLENLSKDQIPEELHDLDTSAFTVTFGYDNDDPGLYLFVSSHQDWFFDLHGKGFWPNAFHSGHHPTSVIEVDGDLVLAGRDGCVRTIGGDDDDGEVIQSHLLIGPLPLADPSSYGRILSLHGALGEDSGSVTWNLITADTAENAVENAKLALGLYQDGDTVGAAAMVQDSGTFTAGQNHLQRPHLRGIWVVIWLCSTDSWAFEAITIETVEAGRWR